ncbi:MAG: TetR/AcrR family transcriptional regulator [candidate division WOR-3 bacterium]|nr:TetR/AcrR family transcriptional regulator [candidate division WOR-3 bacterium]MCX7946976.1 TetR/AcrR family transcriptional regulator [candidate division WOR-3 bacterium]MDW8149983.1 TetR/AcrR family transcriptional regulator [candidate division WOR-3 bacterium]
MTEKSSKRDKIIEIAKKHFIEKGYYKTNLDEVAKELNIAKGTIYLYFQSKSELFIEIVENDLRSLIDDLKDIMNKEKEPKKKLERFIDILWDKLYEFRNSLRMPEISQREFIFDEEIFPLYMHRIYPIISELKTITRSIIMEGIHEGQLKDLEVSALSYFIGLSIKAFFMRFEDPVRYEDKEIIKEVILRGVLKS